MNRIKARCAVDTTSGQKWASLKTTHVPLNNLASITPGYLDLIASGLWLFHAFSSIPLRSSTFLRLCKTFCLCARAVDSGCHCVIGWQDKMTYIACGREVKDAVSFNGVPVA